MQMNTTQSQDFTTSQGLAKPLRLQQLENYLKLDPFLDFVEDVFDTPISDDDTLSETDDDSDTERFGPKGIYTSRDEAREDRSHCYNLSEVGAERAWLRTVLLSDSEEELSLDSSEVSDDEERASRDNERIRDLLKEHAFKHKYRSKFAHQPQLLRQYQYYGSGLVSTCDRYPAHRAAVCKEIASLQFNNTLSPDHSGAAGKKRKFRPGEGSSSMKGAKRIKKEYPDTGDGYNDADSWLDCKDEAEAFSPGSFGGIKFSGSSKSRRKGGTGPTSIETMNARRRKLWLHIVKKEIGKTQRTRVNNHKDQLASAKRAAALCMRVCRNKASQSQKNMKETVWRMKRLTREMQTQQKKMERVEREIRKRKEREEEEQRKIDVEILEAKRQQRKLNFLITQTELYAHFMQRKLVSEYSAEPKEMAKILGQLDETDRPARLAAIDDYDSERMKNKAQLNVSQALSMDQARVQMFPIIKSEPECLQPTQEQPQMFQGVLKHYQIKGVSWLANLYDQGINGILADEMGLGKTVQSIAFLCHIAEKYSIWGPFLVISPASTLHNWQQEFAKFVPQLKVIPYWGNPQERRILRQFWAQKNVHTEEASFHVVITSYQLVVADIKYFNRVKWQYLVLDEAQAIKSSSSVRWKSLLGFQCRNRLLLSGTPVQNSMAELWALLHFIMPTLFDNHEEFAEWFSKDIESHAENKGSIDEKHLSRLHMILKPFMLRRIKKDVENELSDKIELMVYCPLTTRQKLLYHALKKKIRIEDLLHSSSSSQQSSVTSSLMNLVMQFRKVCNHPELFERQEPRVAYHCKPLDMWIPRLVFDASLLPDLNPEASKAAIKLLCPFTAESIHRNTLGDEPLRTFSFLRYIGITPAQLAAVHDYGAPKIWELEALKRDGPSHKLRLDLPPSLPAQGAHEGLLFTKRTNCRIHSFGSVAYHSMPETLEHRILRSSKLRAKLRDEQFLSKTSLVPIQAGPSQAHLIRSGMFGQQQPIKPLHPAPQPIRMVVPEFKYVQRPVQRLECQPLELPKFITYLPSNVDSRSRNLFCGGSRRAANVFASLQTVAGHKLGKRRTPVCEHIPWGSAANKGGLEGAMPLHGWSSVLIPDKQSLISDAGKLAILDGMLHRLKSQGHRVLVYSQMTRMIDLLEEFMYYRKHTYMRLDGSSKISERRDMVADFQNREDIFVFLLSTRAGGLGINLTAADTVIFYDSDWNPTVDQQAMDRAHRLGQTKQVTVYRLICKDTIEERILQRAQEKSEIQRMVISGGSFKPDTLKPTEVVSLLLDDAEIERKYRQRQAERRGMEEHKPPVIKVEPASDLVLIEEEILQPPSPIVVDEDSSGNLIVDVEGLSQSVAPPLAPSPPPVVASQTSSSSSSSVRPAFQQSSSRILNAVRGLSSSQQRGTHGRSRGRPRGSRGRGRPSSKPSYHPPIAEEAGVSSSSSSSPVVRPGMRRGPGRPRLKPYGPGHQSNVRGSRKKEIGSAGSSLEISSGSSPASSASRENKEREFKSFNLFLQ